MWFSRLPLIISIALVVLSVAGIAGITHISEGVNSLSNFWQGFVIVGGLASFAGLFSGLGGILLCFAVESDENGYFRPRANLLGRAAAALASTDSNGMGYCGTSALFGFGLFIGLLLLSGFGGLTYLAISDWTAFTVFMTELAKTLGMMLALVGGLVGYVIFLRLVSKWSPRIGAYLWTASGIGFIAFIGYSIYVSEKKPVDWFGLLEGLVTFGVWFGIPLFLYLVLRRMEIHQHMCPTIRPKVTDQVRS